MTLTGGPGERGESSSGGVGDADEKITEFASDEGFFQSGELLAALEEAGKAGDEGSGDGSGQEGDGGGEDGGHYNEAMDESLYDFSEGAAAASAAAPEFSSGFDSVEERQDDRGSTGMERRARCGRREAKCGGR